VARQPLLYPDGALVKCIPSSIEPDRAGAVALLLNLVQGAAGKAQVPYKFLSRKRSLGMAKKNAPATPTAANLMPGFQHLIPSTAASPMPAHVRPLFLPDLVHQAARNKQIDAQKRDRAHVDFSKWARDLKAGVVQQLNETQVEQDFNHVLLRALGYTTQSDVAAGQPWTLTPKWPVPGSVEFDAALGKFRFDETGKLTGEPMVMVELKGARNDFDRKTPTRNITPVQQVWNYLNASDSAQWAVVCN
jgi:hypothetical protein